MLIFATCCWGKPHFAWDNCCKYNVHTLIHVMCPFGGGARANSNLRGVRLPRGCVDFYREDTNIIKNWILSLFFFVCGCGRTHNSLYRSIHAPQEKTHLNLWSITMPYYVHICVFIMNGLPLQPLLTMAACKKVCCDRCITNKFFRVDET